MTHDLEALAARVEAAGGADRELDAEICLAIGEAGGNMIVTTEGWVVGGDTPAPALASRYTASLDAAMSLVPKGWDWAIYAGADNRCQAGCAPEDTDDGCRTADSDGSIAVTPALALTAAALRAIAATNSETTSG